MAVPEVMEELAAPVVLVAVAGKGELVEAVDTQDKEEARGLAVLAEAADR